MTEIKTPTAGERSALPAGSPRRFYWKQAYRLDDGLHWALHDTETDRILPGHCTSLEMILQTTLRSHFGVRVDKAEFPKLIVKLLNAHFEKQANKSGQAQRPAGDDNGS